MLNSLFIVFLVVLILLLMIIYSVYRGLVLKMNMPYKYLSFTFPTLKDSDLIKEYKIPKEIKKNLTIFAIVSWAIDIIALFMVISFLIVSITLSIVYKIKFTNNRTLIPYVALSAICLIALSVEIYTKTEIAKIYWTWLKNSKKPEAREFDEWVQSNIDYDKTLIHLNWDILKIKKSPEQRQEVELLKPYEFIYYLRRKNQFKTNYALYYLLINPNQCVVSDYKRQNIPLNETMYFSFWLSIYNLGKTTNLKNKNFEVVENYVETYFESIEKANPDFINKWKNQNKDIKNNQS
ncbi:hypothetical protein [Mycoplasma nasistruthionis]|nr:hypothetical protein [Mycoplasma nasistruthionis]